jgi:hypothetical protein
MTPEPSALIGEERRRMIDLYVKVDALDLLLIHLLGGGYNAAGRCDGPLKEIGDEDMSEDVRLRHLGDETPPGQNRVFESALARTVLPRR